MKQLALALVALALLLVPRSFAESGDTLVIGPLQVRIECPWPSTVTKGYQPVRFTATNAGESTEVLEVILKAGYNNALRVERTVGVGPLETLEFELMVPAYVTNGRSFRAELTVGSETKTSNTLGQVGASSEYGHDVVIFSGAELPAGQAESWSQALSPPATGSGPSYWGSRWRNLGFDKDADWEAKARVDVVSVPFDRMSGDWRAYTSLDLAVVDLAGGAPPRAGLEALMAWARTGGEVLFAGGDVNNRLAGLGAVTPWLDSRFQLEAVQSPTGVRRYQCGFGRVLVAPTDGLFDDLGLSAAVLDELRSRIRTEWTPSPRASRGRGMGLSPAIPGLGNLPMRAFTLMMLLFGIVVWPVNFLLVKRSGKPVRLLITIPAIALGASLLALGYGLFWQGVDIQTQSTTVGLIDQRSGLAENAEVRSIYAGLAPGRGLVPGAGTAIFPWEAVGDWSQGTTLRIDYRDGEERYRGDFLPSRTQLRQALVSDRPTRLRVEFLPDGTLTNGLGVDLEELIAHAPDGSWWLLDGRLPAGEVGRLVPTEAPQPALTKFTPFNASGDWTLPRGTYSAVTASPALRDPAGLELTEVAGHHSLLGVLARDAAFPEATK